MGGALGCSEPEGKPNPADSDSGEVATTVEVADFELTLRIVLPLNQGNLFDSVEQLDIIVSQDGTEVDRFSLAELQRGDIDRANEGLPELDGAVIALEGFAADGSLVAVGKSGPLDAASGPSEAHIFVARVESFGWLYNLSSPTVGAPLVADGKGSLFLFGGASDGRPSERLTFLGSPSIRRLNLNQADDGLEFSTIGDMPSFTDTDTEGSGRAGHSATRLGGTHDDSDFVFVAGGSTSLWDATEVTDHAFLWDPATESVVEEFTLQNPVSRHIAVADLAGNVVISGGTTRARSNNSYYAHRVMMFYNGTSREASLVVIPSEEEDWVHHGAAVFGERGVLMCGGFRFEGDGVDYGALDGCGIMSTNGTYTGQAESGIALPSPRFHHAMVGLADGSVLVTGGASYDSGVYSVSNDAWILDPSGTIWTPVGPMHLARALHAMTLLPDGRVLVAGGATGLTDHWWDGETAVSCAEIFNPELGDFVEVGTCASASADGNLPGPVTIPAIATEPTRGMAVVVGGMDTENLGSVGVSVYLAPAD
jgi:hypothetical protein